MLNLKRFGLISLVLAAVMAGLVSPTLSQKAYAETDKIGGSIVQVASNVSVPNQSLINRALASKRIFSLIKIIKKVERVYGGKVLNAGLLSTNPNQISTWYYYIKHRSSSGRVTTKYFSARTGKEFK
ncbi:MAG: hypothetical protein ACPGVN_04700 [Alphaproteobacteria bacterium]